MRSRLVVALIAAASIGFISIADGCSERKDNAAAAVETASAAAGAKAQPAESLISAKDDEGFDLPEREEIRQTRKLIPGTEVFVIGVNHFSADTDHTQVFVIGINGKVKVETADTDTAEVLVVRSAHKRKDLQRQKVHINDHENLYIRVGDDDSPDPIAEIRQRVILRLPRKAGLEIREINGDVTVGGIGGHLQITHVGGIIRVVRAAGPIVVYDVTGGIDITFAPLKRNSIKIGGEVNGNVDLRFEGELNADLNAWSVNGDIKSDFPNLGVRNTDPEWGRLKARIGNGGSVIEIHDVNGNVTLSKAGNRTTSTPKVAAKSEHIALGH